MILVSLPFPDRAWALLTWMSFWGCGWLAYDYGIELCSVGALGGSLGGDPVLGRGQQ